LGILMAGLGLAASIAAIAAVEAATTASIADIAAAEAATASISGIDSRGAAGFIAHGVWGGGGSLCAFVIICMFSTYACSSLSPSPFLPKHNCFFFQLHNLNSDSQL
jgi:hypothetical protein